MIKKAIKKGLTKSKSVKSGKVKSKTSKSIKKMSKSEAAVLTAEKMKLDPTNVKRIREMFSSEDKENHVVALAILNQCDVKTELPYLLILYKRFGIKNEELWKTEAPDLMKNFKKENVKLDTPNLTYKNILRLVAKDFSPLEVQAIADDFSDNLRKHAINWGMDFLNEWDIQLAPRK